MLVLSKEKINLMAMTDTVFQNLHLLLVCGVVRHASFKGGRDSILSCKSFKFTLILKCEICSILLAILRKKSIG